MAQDYTAESLKDGRAGGCLSKVFALKAGRPELWYCDGLNESGPRRLTGNGTVRKHGLVGGGTALLEQM